MNSIGVGKVISTLSSPAAVCVFMKADHSSVPPVPPFLNNTLDAAVPPLSEKACRNVLPVVTAADDESFLALHAVIIATLSEEVNDRVGQEADELVKQ